MTEDLQVQSQLRCKPLSWLSITTFILLNYVAHCATVKSYPGESAVASFIAAILAFFFPSSGVIRAWSSVVRHARLKLDCTDLKRVCRAGALCMVVRNKDWTPNPRIASTIRGVSYNGRKFRRTSNTLTLLPPIYYSVVKPRHNLEQLMTFDTSADRVQKNHGNCRLPTGFRWTIVPSDANVTKLDQSDLQTEPDNGQPPVEKSEIASSYSAPKALIALLQTLYASFTLYRTRGKQIERYGYAAFGLTVTPYLVMLVWNLIAQLATPEYSAAFMVWTPEMKEAEEYGGYFEGMDLEIASVNGRSMISSRHGRLRRGVNEEVYRGFDDMRRSIESSPNKSCDLIEVPACGPIARKKAIRMSASLKWRKGFLWTIGPAIISSLSLTVVGVLSNGFSNGQSTRVQRAWVLSRIVMRMIMGGFGQWVGRLYVKAAASYGTRDFRSHALKLLLATLAVGICCAPATGGMVIVIRMLNDYGDCIRW